MTYFLKKLHKLIIFSEKLKAPNLRRWYCGRPEFPTILPSPLKMSSFHAAKAAVLSSIMAEPPDNGMHAMWINCKIAALKKMESEADLATTEEIAAAGHNFDAHIEVSNYIRKAMASVPAPASSSVRTRGGAAAGAGSRAASTS